MGPAFDMSDIETHDETTMAENDDVPVHSCVTIKLDGTSAGTLLGVVAKVVIDSVCCFENKGKITAVTPLDIGECHSLI